MKSNLKGIMVKTLRKAAKFLEGIESDQEIARRIEQVEREKILGYILPSQSNKIAADNKAKIIKWYKVGNYMPITGLRVSIVDRKGKEIQYKVCGVTKDNRQDKLDNLRYGDKLRLAYLGDDGIDKTSVAIVKE